MQLEEQIFSALTAGSPITSAGDRVYPEVAPEGAALPRITYTRVSTAPQNSLSGHSGLDQVVVQLDCWARTKIGALTLAREVRAAMEGRTFKALAAAAYDGFEAESRLYRHTVEFSCWDKTF